MDKKFLTDIKNIRSAIDTNKLAVFVGAGVSFDSGVPGWGALIEELKSEVAIPHNEQDYLRIAQMYFNDRQLKEFVDKVRAVLKHKKVKHNDIHEEIFRLTPEHILTTNFDDLLEQVIKKKSLPFSIVTKDSEFPYAMNTGLLVKIHGDLDNTDIVLKEDDYIDYSLNHPLIEAFLKSIFASKIVLFVGYSFSDIDLKMIVQSVRNILGNDFQNAYLLSVDENLHPTQREYLKRKGVNVVSYFDGKDSNGVNYIEEYLKGNNALREQYFKKSDNLSSIGQNLLNFLRFISCYDKFNEPLTEKNLIDQIYYSLNRFSEFKSLPPDFVANLYPFNVSKRYVDNYQLYSLITQNHKLYDLFFNQIYYDNDEVRFRPSQEMGLTAELIDAYEAKLRDIIRLLNRSLIFYLFKENEKPDSFGNLGWSNKYKKLLVKPEPKCNCLLCRLGRFELSSVISEVLSSSIGETTSVQSDLELAYINYKLGNFTQSFRLFEDVANKAWQAGKYFSYYIAKRNVRYLTNPIQAFDRTLTAEEKSKVLDEIREIDIDKLLFQIPFMGSNEYDLLKSLRDDDVIKEVKREVEKLKGHVLEVYDGYQRGTRFTTSDYPELIELELRKLGTFYTTNFIIGDASTEFVLICKNALESWVASFATSQDYKEKLKEFNKLFFDIAVFYCDTDDIKGVMVKYNVESLAFNKKSRPEILESINNFLASFFKINKSLGGYVSANAVTKSQIGNDFFSDKCRRYFSNMFLILSKMKLDKENDIEVIFNLINFLAHEDFLFYSNVNYLNAFIRSNYWMFTREDLIGLLKMVPHKIALNRNEEICSSLAFAFEQNGYEAISDSGLINSILIIDVGKKRGVRNLTSFWPIANAEIQGQLKGQILRVLNEDFDSDLYRNAVYKKIIDYNEFLEEYLNEINTTKGTGDYTLSEGKLRLNSYVFINAMALIYSLELGRDDERLNLFTNLSDYMAFYLFPEKFDYVKFKVEWLYIWDLERFFNRFAKVPLIKKAIEEELKKNFTKELAIIYTKYFL